MAPLNIAGPVVFDKLPELEALDARKAFELQSAGRPLVDARRSVVFTQGLRAARV